MDDSERRRYGTFRRVREYGTTRNAEFPAATLAGRLFSNLNAVIEELDTLSATQASEHSATLESSAGKASARDELRSDLEPISRAARVMALTMPGFEDKFRMPRSVSDQALLATARAFAADALPLKAEFIQRGLPDTFLEDLAADIETFEQAINRKIQRHEARVAATAAIDDAVERGINLVRELDAIMRNKYAGDPSSLAAWISASHTERRPRRSGSNPNPPTQPPAPPTPAG